MKKISTAYKDLKKFLPNESEIKNTWGIYFFQY
jgi:hypothetical protein